MEATLCMVNIVGHYLLGNQYKKDIGDILWMNTIFQPTIYSIKGPHYRLQYFYMMKTSVHLRDFRQREIHSYVSYLDNFASNV